MSNGATEFLDIITEYSLKGLFIKYVTFYGGGTGSEPKLNVGKSKETI